MTLRRFFAMPTVRPRVYRRIRLFGGIHLGMLLAFAGIVAATVPEPRARTTILLALASATIFPLLLLLVRPGAFVYICAITSLVVSTISSAIIDPATGFASGIPWLLQLIWPPISLLIFRNLRIFWRMALLATVLLISVPLLEVTGTVAVILLSTPTHMVMLWLALVVLQIVLVIVVGLAGRDAERALDESHQAVTSLAATNQALSTAYADIQIAHAQVSDAVGQQQRLREQVLQLSAPVIDLGSGLILVPLMGEVDSARIDHLTTSLLTHIHATRPTRVLLDMTGMVLVDSHIVQDLDPLIRAIRLLGCHVSITGVSAALAQILVTTAHATLAQHAAPLTETLRHHLGMPHT
jgi:anti-anti-sigma regulatory factor